MKTAIKSEGSPAFRSWSSIWWDDDDDDSYEEDDDDDDFDDLRAFGASSLVAARIWASCAGQRVCALVSPALLSARSRGRTIRGSA